MERLDGSLELPRGYLENLERDPEGTQNTNFDMAARNVFDSYIENAPGLKNKWASLCANAVEDFVRIYEKYVERGTDLKEAMPEHYQFLKDHVFYGEEFEPRESAAFSRLQELPTGEIASVYGNPYRWADILDWKQGDNLFRFGGDCGLVSCENVLRMAGINISETDVVRFAKDSGLCSVSRDLDNSGGTSPHDRVKILKHYGIDSHVDFSVTPEKIANAIESNRGIIMGLNAGVLWEDGKYYGDGASNHAITVTGVARETGSGDIKGFYICDSGRQLHTDGARYVPLELLREAWSVPRGSIIITDAPIKKEEVTA